MQFPWPSFDVRHWIVGIIGLFEMLRKMRVPKLHATLWGNYVWGSRVRVRGGCAEGVRVLAEGTQRGADEAVAGSA